MRVWSSECSTQSGNLIPRGGIPKSVGNLPQTQTQIFLVCGFLVCDMYIYIYIYISFSLSLYIYTYVCICIFTYTYIHTHMVHTVDRRDPLGSDPDISISCNIMLHSSYYIMLQDSILVRMIAYYIIQLTTIIINIISNISFSSYFIIIISRWLLCGMGEIPVWSRTLISKKTSLSLYIYVYTYTCMCIYIYIYT